MLRTILFFSVIFYSLVSIAQDFPGLQKVAGAKSSAWHSEGAGGKAKIMADRTERVMRYYDEILGFRPAVSLLVLSADDWPKFTSMPVYGMPHYTNSKTLIVAANDNAFWQGMVPPAERLPASYRELLHKSYPEISGKISMEPFFDLLAIHELGHAYYNQDSLGSQRRWLSELFCNILLHTWVAEREPSLLPALTAFPRMVVGTTDKNKLRYTTLKDLEENYNRIGPEFPENYGWYQCRWHVAAGKIYDQEKISGIINLRKALKSERKKLSDEDLMKLLKNNNALVDMYTNWDSQ